MSLRVAACPRGFVAGPIQWIDNRRTVTDCSNRVQSIPTIVDAIAVQTTGETIFLRLVQSTIVNEVIFIGCL
jgi:hypothetical protein